MECMTKECEAAMLMNLDSVSQRELGISVPVKHSLGHHISPQSHFRCSIPEHLVGDGGEVVDQAKICLRICLPLGLGVDAKLGEGKLASLPPQLNSGLDFWSPQEVRLLGSLWRFGHHGSGAVHVIAPDLVFRAIAAASVSIFETWQTCFVWKPTIAGTSHHSGCVFSCTSCSPFGTWCDCA